MKGLRKNEGPMDRVLRIILGAIIASIVYLYIHGTLLGWIGYLVAAILVVTGLTGFIGCYWFNRFLLNLQAFRYINEIKILNLFFI